MPRHRARLLASAAAAAALIHEAPGAPVDIDAPAPSPPAAARRLTTVAIPLPSPEDDPLRPNALLPPPAAARWLTVAVQTLARWRVQGTGPPFLKIGGRVAYRRGDLDDWLASRRFTSTTDRRAG